MRDGEIDELLAPGRRGLKHGSPTSNGDKTMSQRIASLHAAMHCSRWQPWHRAPPACPRSLSLHRRIGTVTLHPAQRHRLRRRHDHARGAARRSAKALGHAGRGRQPARRRRRRRPAGAGALGARRHHAERGVEQRRDLPERAQVGAVRHAGRLHADRGGGHDADGAGRQSARCPPTTRRSSSRCSRASRSELNYRLGRQRHHPAPGRRRCSSTRPASRPSTSRTRAWARW